MANTFKKISTVTVGSGGAASIDFTSIPQTYTDLKIVVSARSTGSSGANISMRFNSNSTGYTGRRIVGNGTTVFSDTTSGTAASSGSAILCGPFSDNSNTANVFGTQEIYIPNYTSSNNKSVSIDGVSENNTTTAYQEILVGLWSNTAAITSISLICYQTGNTFGQYTTATLYGVSDVTAAQNAYATGGIITYDDTYVYHTFPWSGTFTPTRSLNVDYLVVAGAGGGGGPGVSGGGGGGAGGVRCTVGATGGGGSLESQLAVTATAYTVTVGAGGAADTIGNNSVFGSITSTAGGRGKSSGSAANANGGSGGGGNGTAAGISANIAGTGTANQGYAGGDGFPGPGDNARNSGGGGGAGSVGAAGTASVGGNGGSGITTSISGTSTVYAGGGGGGVGYGTRGTGTDGGGNGGNGSTAGVAGTANRGAGGGGGGRNESTGTTQSPGAGGSGIVIVRYAR
jgi:hypothetical protein